MLCYGPEETAETQDHEEIKAVTSSLVSAFSASKHPSCETPEPLICQIGEISLRVVRRNLLKDCETLGSNGIGQVTETNAKSY